MKEINEMQMLELEEEFERTASTAFKITRKEMREYEVGVELMKKYKAEIERLTKPV